MNCPQCNATLAELAIDTHGSRWLTCPHCQAQWETVDGEILDLIRELGAEVESVEDTEFEWRCPQCQGQIENYDVYAMGDDNAPDHVWICPTCETGYTDQQMRTTWQYPPDYACPACENTMTYFGYFESDHSFHCQDCNLWWSMAELDDLNAVEE